MSETLPPGFSSFMVTNGAVKTRCVGAGPAEGPLVVLLHGFPERWSTWRDTLGALANAGFRAVAPDLRGYGASDRPSGVADYSVTRLVEDVEAIVRACGQSKAFIVGHDFGGGVAWATAMLQPSLVDRLAILNSIHPVGFERQMRRWSQIKKSWYIFLFLLPWLPEWLLGRQDFRFVRRSLADDGLSTDLVEDLLEGIRPPGALHAAIDWYRASFRDGAGKRLKPVRVDHPVLVVWGDRERYFDPELATPPSDWATNVRVEHFPDGSHWVHLQEPERVARLLIEHFRSA